METATYQESDGNHPENQDKSIQEKKVPVPEFATKFMLLTNEIAKCHHIHPGLIATVSEEHPGEGLSPRDYKHLFYQADWKIHFYARHQHLAHERPGPFRARLEDNEKIADYSKKPGESVYLVRQRLSDGSAVYNILVGNVRINCVNEESANELFWFLTKKGEIAIELDY
jgi:hypothetical protein